MIATWCLLALCGALRGGAAPDPLAEIESRLAAGDAPGAISIAEERLSALAGSPEAARWPLRFWLARGLAQQGRYELALEQYEAVIHALEGATGSAASDLADALRFRAEALVGSGRSEAALQDLERALALRAEQLPADDPALATARRMVCERLRALGRFDDADRCLDEAEAALIGRAARSVESPLLGAARGSIQLQRGDYLAARSTLEAAARRIQAFAEAGDRLQAVFTDLGNCYRQLGEHELAAQTLGRALGEARRLARCPEAGTCADPTVAKALNNLAVLARARGDLTSARTLFGEALATTEAALGADHPIVAPILNNLAVLELQLDRISESRRLLERSLAIQRAFQGPDHPTVITMVENLAGVAVREGDFEAAVALYRESLAARERVLGADHLDTALSARNLGTTLSRLGRTAEAVPFLERALRVTVAEAPVDGLDVASACVALADALGHGVDALRARGLYERALEIRAATLGPDHLDVAFVHGSLGSLALAVGDHEEALRSFSAALAVRERVLGPESRSVAATLTSLAVVHARLGRRAEAEALNLRALAIATGGGPISTELELTAAASALHNLGALALDAGDLDGAEARFREVATLDVSGEHQRRSWLAQTEVRLAEVSLRRKDPAGALARIDAALPDLRAEDDLGPKVTEALRWKAEALLAAGDASGAREVMEEVRGAWTGPQAALLESSSEREGLALVASRRAELDTYLRAWSAPEHVEQAWGAVLLWKNAVARANADVRQEASQGTALASAAALEEVRRELSRATLAGETAAIAAWSARKDALERQRARATAPTLEAGELCGALPEGATLVDFLRTGAGYAAFVAGGRPCALTRIELPDGDGIDRAVTGWRATLTTLGGAGRRASTERIDGRGELVRRLVWDPIADKVPTERVLLVPDGPLAALPFAALPDGDGYLVERHEFAMLESAHALAHRPAPPGSGALLVGDLDFTSARDSGEAALATRSSCLPATFPALPGTAREIARLESRWADRREREPLVVLRGQQATEERVVAALPGQRLIHLATHGFAASGCGAGAATSPMSLSGVALSGAASAPDPFSPWDGLLTAEEVRGLDLRGTELVVLSACDTGLGDTRPGEGVLGLRRALAEAGARWLVLGLWSLPDDPTAAIMDGLYARLLRRRGPLEPAAALRRAQLELLGRARRELGHGDPSSWGAFVALGAPSGAASSR